MFNGFTFQPLRLDFTASINCKLGGSSNARFLTQIILFQNTSVEFYCTVGFFLARGKGCQINQFKMKYKRCVTSC